MRSFIIVLLLSGIFLVLLLLKPEPEPVVAKPTAMMRPVACLMLIGVFTRCPPKFQEWHWYGEPMR